MADINLRPIELNNPQQFPDCCIVCGRSSTTLTEVRFSHSFNSGHRTTTTRWVDTEVPLCDRHTGHFRNYTIFATCGIVGFMLLVVVSIALGVLTPLKDAAIGFGVGGGLLGGLIVVPTLVIWRWMMVHATNVDGKGVRLCNVAERFVDEVEEARLDRGEKARDRRDSRRRPDYS